ncbi:MAG: hypothetical protein LW809_05095 [Vampirovibrionales bacterium]|jgi:hypothetical protein|nr:hypothetical protein [Vampirovibrionales bacterium]
MISKLKDFMFSTPLTYSELRAVKQIQSLKHVKSHASEQRVKAAQEQESKPKVRISISTLSEWRKYSPLYFAGAGAGAGVLWGTFKASKHPVTRIWQDPPTNKTYHLETFGQWKANQALPSGGYNLKTFEAGDAVEKVTVSQRYHSLWDALMLSPKKYANVLRRQYQEGRFIDTDVKENKDGTTLFNRSMKSKQGIFPLFEARLNNQGELEKLIHTFHRNGQDFHVNLSPTTVEGKMALWTQEKMGRFTFLLNNHARTARMLVEDPTTTHRYQVFSTVENIGQYTKNPSFHAENSPVRILKNNKKVAWQDLSVHEKMLLEHPLFFRQLMPQPKDKALLDIASHIPTPLRSTPFHADLRKGLQRHVPWKEWLGKPFSYGMAFAGLAVLTQQFLLSPKSPFSQWLSEHVEVHHRSAHHLMGTSLPENEKILYVKDTGNDSADASIGKALRVLSNFGLIKTSVVHQSKKKHEKIEKLIESSKQAQNA